MQRMGLSRATLFRHFKPLGGVRNYIQQRRLSRALQAVADGESADARIGAIARRHGFSGDAVFSRAFRNLFGMSPSDVRGMIEKNRATPPQIVMQGFSHASRWLKAVDAAG
jgi:AraC-like DNA-binding protein